MVSMKIFETRTIDYLENQEFFQNFGPHPAPEQRSEVKKKVILTSFKF